MNATAAKNNHSSLRKREASTPSGVRAEIRLITPEEAAALLKRNRRNRPLSDKTVRRYAQVMEDGEWRLTTDAIGIDVNGDLTNAQHRLNAVVVSGRAQQFVVVEGLSTDAFEATDVGKRRSASDTLSLLGYPNASILGYICRCVANYIDAGCQLKTSTTKLSQENYRIAEIAQTYPQLRESASFARSVVDGFAGICSPSMYGFLHFLASEGGHQGAFERFGTSVSTGLHIEKDTGAHRLRDRLLTTALSKESLPESEVLAITVKAFRLDIAGRKVKNLRWRSAGDKVEGFPQMPDSPTL